MNYTYISMYKFQNLYNVVGEHTVEGVWLAFARHTKIDRRGEACKLLEQTGKARSRLKPHAFCYGLDGEIAIMFLVVQPSASFFQSIFVQKRVEIAAMLLGIFPRQVLEELGFCENV